MTQADIDYLKKLSPFEAVTYLLRGRRWTDEEADELEWLVECGRKC